jgi:hypothetical protein
MRYWCVNKNHTLSTGREDTYGRRSATPTGPGTRSLLCAGPATRPYFPAKEVTVKIVQHIGDDLLAQYAVQALPEADVIPLEEHLLICPNCLDRLQAELEFVAAMRGAAATIREVEKS